MARPASRAVALTVLLLLLACVPLVGFAVAQGNETDDGAAENDTAENDTGGDGGAAGGGAGDYDYVVTVREATCEGGCAFDIPVLSAPAESKILLVYNSAGATEGQLHNAHPTEGAVDLTAVEADGLPIEPDAGRSSWAFTMPASGEVSFKCDVHPEMTGVIEVGAFGGGGGATTSIVHEGVHFLAHWVGVIAFATLFVMYGITFFLFKNNETGFTTDHKDRAVPAGGAADVYGQDVRVSRATAIVLAILLTVVAIALVWALANGMIGG